MVKINDGCIGCGLCTSICPEVFRMNDENLAEVYKEPNEAEKPAAMEAAGSCPVSVIEVNS